MSDQPSDYQITEAMIVYGGSFVSKIGEAWRCADDENRAKLRAAFAYYWVTYAELAVLKARKGSEATA